MKPLDAGFFFVEKPEAPAHFGPLIILSRPDGAGDDFVRKGVEIWRSSKEFASPFNYRLNLLPVPSWDVLEDDQIDLDYHLRHVALPAPGGERELGVMISQLHSYPLDRSRPLWECYVIEGLEGDRFAIYLKLHHGQVDGMGAVRLMSRVFSTDPLARDMQPPWSVGLKASASSGDGNAGYLAKLQGLQRTLNAVPKAATTMGKLYLEAFSGAPDSAVAPFQAPWTILNERIGAARRYATQHYTLDRLKRVAKLGGVTVNDVFLSMCGGALRRYLTEFSQLPEKSLIAQVPVSIRSDDDASVGNALAFIYVALGTDIEDPILRLDAVSKSSEAGKKTHRDLPQASVDPYTMMLQGPWISQVVSNLSGRVPPAANLVISNVPGPRERLHFNGARVEHIYGPSVLFHGQALNITMSSYAGDLDAGFTGCRESLQSLQNLAVYTGEALEEIEAALKPRRKRQTKKKASKRRRSR